MVRVVAIVTLAISVVSVLPAQQVTFDLCQLTIHVRAADGRELGTRVQIELLGPSGTPIGTAQTNEDGVAYFQVSSGYSYMAKVSGREVEPVTSQFSILGGQPMHTENMTVRRALRTTNVPPGSSGTVSVLEMNVPKKARDEMQKGIHAFDHGDYVKAREKFQKAISIYPGYARAYANMGIVALKSGDARTAQELFSKSIEVDGKYLPAYIDLARIEVQDKRYAEAESVLTKALGVNPSFPEAVALLADAEYRNDEYEKALADAQRVHTFPDHEKFANIHLLAAAILEMQNRNREAIEQYRTFLKEAPNSSKAEAVQKEISGLEAATH